MPAPENESSSRPSSGRGLRPRLRRYCRAAACPSSAKARTPLPPRPTFPEPRDAGEVLLLLHIGAAAGRFEHPQISLMAHEIPRQRPAVAAVPACLKELGGSAYREGLDGMTVLAEVAARSRADQMRSRRVGGEHCLRDHGRGWNALGDDRGRGAI